LPISSPNNRVLTDNVSLWSCIVADQYEIEALAIFTEDIVLKLIEKSTHGPACTFEILDSTLLCFIPFDSPNVKELFVYEKTADTFASILLPQLEKATMATIGNIPPVLSVDLREEEIQYTDLSEDEKKRQKWMVVIAISTFIIGGATINLSAKGVVSPWVISLVIFISFFLIVLLMPKRIRKQWMNGSGLRVNGRSVRIIKEIK
jgi:hypothetical protein